MNHWQIFKTTASSDSRAVWAPALSTPRGPLGGSRFVPAPAPGCPPHVAAEMNRLPPPPGAESVQGSLVPAQGPREGRLVCRRPMGLASNSGHRRGLEKKWGSRLAWSVLEKVKASGSLCFLAVWALA